MVVLKVNRFRRQVIQFGYIALFSLALPLAPLIALLNNVLEVSATTCTSHRVAL